MFLLLFLLFHLILAEHPPPPPDTSFNVTNKWIAKFRKQYRLSQDMSIFSQAEAVNTFALGDNDFVLYTSTSTMQILDIDPLVEYKEPVKIVTITDVPWGIRRISQPDLPIPSNLSVNVPYNGSNVDVYVIDTGVLDSHVELKNRAFTNISTISTEPNVRTDLNSHGTHVSGIIGGSTVGVAPGVRIIGVRAADAFGHGTTTDIMLGVRWILSVAKKPSIINLSMGTSFSRAINDAFQALSDAGHIVVVAAGNAKQDACLTSPASLGGSAKSKYGVITVAASDTLDYRAFFSNFGRCIDIFAPGVGIYSSGIISNSSYIIKGGTSQACPHVAGVLALLMQKHSLNKTAAIDEFFNISVGGKIRDTLGTVNLLLQKTLGASITKFGLCVYPKLCTSDFLEIGAPLNRSGSNNFDLYIPESKLCNLQESLPPLAGKGIIVPRGGCSIQRKVTVAQKFNASLLIVTSNRPGPLKWNGLVSYPMQSILVNRDFGDLLYTKASQGWKLLTKYYDEV